MRLSPIVADLWRRTSLRIALAFATALVATLALAGLVALGMIRAQLAADRDQRLLDAHAEMVREFEADGEAGLRDAIAERLAAAPAGAPLTQLRGPDGTVLAGTPGAVEAPPGFSDLALGAGALRVYRAPAGPGDLILGDASDLIGEVGEIVVGAFGWAAVVVLIVALGGGALVARRVQGVVDRVDAAMARVAGGDLAARIPGARGGGELERLAGRINAALGRLEGLVEGMRQVSSDVAHDLRAPLNRLRLRLEAAQAGAVEGTPVAVELAAALEEAGRIDATFAALLRIAQVEAGARRDRFARLDLATVAARVAEAYAAVAEDAGQTLALDARPAPVTGDPELLTQALANLVENAIRHAGPGARVSVATAAGPGGAVLTIADDGPGIPEADRARVLGRFVRLERSRTTPGTGLGLTLVKAVADLHGVRLGLEDAGPGLRVRLSFPPP